MKNKLFRTLSIALIIIFVSSTYIYPQNDNDDGHTITIIIPKIALLDIESATSKDISLKMVSPKEAGNPLFSASDNNIWLNVTSIVETGATRDISVKIDAPITGLNLNVVSAPYSGSGFGSWGTPGTELLLTTYDQTLVNGIKSGETGDGANNGFNLKYIAKSNKENFGEILSKTDEEITVTYTLTH